jgi:transcription antitermination factor NusG
MSLQPLSNLQLSNIAGMPGVAESHRRWFALSTFSNSEKQVERHLDIRGIEKFLPLHTVVKKWKNRTTVKLELPLFAGYIFVKIAPEERIKALQIPNVLSIVGSGRNPLALPDDEIELLKKDLHLRVTEPHRYLTTGTRARIRSGPLAGMVGIVTRVDSRLRVVLSFELLMRSVAVHVDANELECCS